MDGETDRREVSAALRLYKDSTAYTVSGELVSATQETAEGDFACDASVRMALEDLADASVSVKLSSGEYEEVAMPEACVNLETATQEEIDALKTALDTGLINALYLTLSAMPQEAMALLQ